MRQRSTREVLNALVELRAIARGNQMRLYMGVQRPERRAPVRVTVSVRTAAGGIQSTLPYDHDPVDFINSIIYSLQQCNITVREYE